MATVQEIRDQVRTAIAEADYSRALSLVQLIRRHFPEDYETAALLGQIQLEKGRYQEARDAYQAVLEADPENVLARWALATIAEEEGKLDAALGQLERAFNIDGSNRGLAEEITRLHSQMRHTRPAEPGGWEHALARQLMALKKYGEAVAQFESAVEVTSAEEVAVGLAQALWLADRPKQSEGIARRILLKHPNCIKALAIAAVAAFSRGDEEAITLLNRAAALNPGNSVAALFFKQRRLPVPPIGERVEVPDAEPGELAIPQVAPGAETTDTPAPGDAATAEGTPGGLGLLGTWDLQDEEPWARARPGLRADGFGWLSERAMEVLSESSVGTGDPSETAEKLPVEEAGAPAAPVPDSEGRPPEQPPAVIGEREALETVLETDLQGEDAPGDRTRTEREGDIELHITFARTFEKRGQVDFALDEYRTALKLEPSMAPAVRDAALTIAEAHPDNVKARWLLGDALAVEGQFRKAVEQYLMVLISRDVAEKKRP